MTRDEQEALSRNYSSDMIQLLPLKSGNIAVFNRAGELCGIIDPTTNVWERAEALWKPPAKAKPKLDLEELGL